MLKGCTKRVMFVRLGENALFEEAYFVVRPGAKSVYKEGDFLNEAQKIISKSTSSISDTQRAKFKLPHIAVFVGIIAFLAGSITAIAMTYAVGAVF